MSITLDELFAGCRQQQRAALVGYLPAGYPTVDDSARLLSAVLDAGADLVEGRSALFRSGIGRPDHPGRRWTTALRGGTRIRDVLGAWWSGSLRPVGTRW